MTIRAVVKGVGHYLPERIVPNSEFEATLDTSDEWIRSRSGIAQRHFAAEGEFTSDLAVKAAQSALDNAGLQADDIDAIVLATSTPDLTFPSVATMVQQKLGMTRGFGFDVQAVCAGFVYALTTANALVVSGQAKRVMVIGAETFSRIMDWEDRSTCVLFGDGAGALILEAAEGTGEGSDRGILAADLNSDGRYKDMLYVDGGVSTTGTSGKLRMQGNALFRQAVERLTATARAAMAQVNLKDEDIDWIVPHQANIRIIQGTAKKMGLSMDNVIVTLQDQGNTSAASIPLALSVGVQDGRIKEGDLLVTEAIGGGLAWGSVVLRW
ncbi:beta-ketoacyl-ACP synthase III [Thalassovita mediterranea]|jgi:3-oxoacyl-[acyl-carrier-protein] synthase-3|uniref:Beta-ketoacyl-[acyl-carrier-protein] synthase III n=1 Tax=Thalassovita mediterranea TaxID=340021 RepID=A0A0N7M1L1_9RHOB|nr:beta-ketoacyl-ACP synthase III [Thalassovita mediterranea]CUH83611.1 3-oxoacyl-[acyl-carrier-protein] synthase 3 [Thalassovita mediterranea]SIS28863.1 3-oxoacyl-[acyl-carrier-protein] synthase-3 [Thalassovita mediterranea]